MRFPLNITSDFIGKTAHFSVKIYTNVNCTVYLLLFNNTSQLSMSSVDVNSNSDFELINLSHVIVENTNLIYFNISSSIGVIYIDDLVIKIM